MINNKIELPKIKTRLEVKNKTDGETAELYLYGTIRQASWYDEDGLYISSKQVKDKLVELKGKNINVHINSNGGDVFESIAICNLLKQHDGEVNIYIDAMAGSGASIIATAGKGVYMYDNSMQMVHKAWTIALGNADELRKLAVDLDKVDAAVKASYMSKFVGTEEELETLIADESYLTAEECFAFGLCTEIIKDASEEDVKPQANTKESLFAKYQKSIEAKKADEPKTALLNRFKNKNQEVIKKC